MLVTTGGATTVWGNTDHTAIRLEHVLLDSVLIAASWNSGKQSLAFTHGSGSNVSFFFLSNWCLEIMLHSKKIRHRLNNLKHSKVSKKIYSEWFWSIKSPKSRLNITIKREGERSLTSVAEQDHLLASHCHPESRWSTFRRNDTYTVTINTSWVMNHFRNYMEEHKQFTQERFIY